MVFESKYLQMRSYIIVIIIILLFIKPTNFMTIGATEEEEVATLGENQGSLSGNQTEFWFVFYGSNETDYQFTLRAAYETNFNIELSNSNGYIIAQTDRDAYPEETGRVWGYNEYHIRIFSVEGTGDFTVTIIELQLDKILYTDTFDINGFDYRGFIWFVTKEGDISIFEGLHDGDMIRLEVFANLSDYLYYEDIDLNTAVKFELNGDPIGNEELQWELFKFLFVPIMCTLTDGSSLDLGEILNSGQIKQYQRGLPWTGSSDVSMRYSLIIGSKEHSYFASYFGNVGILSSYSFQIADIGDRENPDSKFRIALSSRYPLNADGDGEGMFGGDTPVKPLWFVLGLVTIPLLRRKILKAI